MTTTVITNEGVSARASRWVRANDGIEVTAALRRQFPAVFAHRAAPSMSEEYQFFRSDKIIEEMDRLKFNLVEIRQQHSSKRDPAYQMHSLRFRPTGQKALAKIGDTVAEAQIINSHNGRNRFIACSGLFRLACLNGLVLPDSLFGSVAMRHFGAKNTFEAVQQIINGLAEQLPSIREKIEHWSSISLSDRQQATMAKMMMEIRVMPDWVKPAQVIEHRRDEDAPNRAGNRDLWKTFNVIQENLTNRALTNDGRGEEDRKRSTAPVFGALANFNLNRLLWAGAEQVAAGMESGRGVPSAFDPDKVATLGRPELDEEAEKSARKMAKEPKAEKAKAKVAKKTKKPAAAHRAETSDRFQAKDSDVTVRKATTKSDTDRKAQLAKRAEAARAYRARKKAGAETASATE